MYVLCLDCYEVYSLSTGKHGVLPIVYCPKARCSGQTVQVDELLIPAIINLNKKGYVTELCCSTHSFGAVPDLGSRERGPNGIYITFGPAVHSLPSVPEGFKAEHSGGPITLKEINYNPERLPNASDRMKLTFERIISLTRWSETIPTNLAGSP